MFPKPRFVFKPLTLISGFCPALSTKAFCSVSKEPALGGTMILVSNVSDFPFSVVTVTFRG